MANGTIVRMKISVILFLVTSSLFAQKADSYLLFEQRNFDSDTCCWRELQREGKYNEAADMIIDFIQYGNVSNRQSLNWHAAQMYAFSGDYESALTYSRKTYNVFQKWFGGNDGKTWYYFAKGTSAFFERNKEKLQKIVQKWNKRLIPDKNLKELELLLANWEFNYKRATSANSLHKKLP